MRDQSNIFRVRSFSNVPKQGQRTLVAASADHGRKPTVVRYALAQNTRTSTLMYPVEPPAIPVQPELMRLPWG